MQEKLNRRDLVKKTVFSSALTAGITRSSRAADHSLPHPGLPTGKIGNLEISRLISGGNLISGWAHARDLNYVHQLMRHYNDDEKVMDTLEQLEENGVNTIIADPSERPYRIFPRYWAERGGKMQWIAEGHPSLDDLKTDILTSVDKGASAIYIQGVIGDLWLRQGQSDRLADCLEIIKSQGLPAGIGAHMLDVIQISEERHYGAEFYVKTFHHDAYWSAIPAENRKPYCWYDGDQKEHDHYHDNIWCLNPAETAAFMRQVDKPWIAFKTLAAGAIHPQDGFRYAFENGADFICVGMFDFQVTEDAVIARSILADPALQQKRTRPWRA